ncbi:MAG: CPBP family intramembrane metalloprotease [Agathobacter sp.]|nr:CPBP family intramembrane metalloprotease [Agathobacter sp.]
MYNKKGVAGKVWEIAYPVLMYYSAITIGSFVAQVILGAGIETYMLCKIIGSLVAIPVVYADYKHDLMLTGKYKIKEAFTKDTWVNLAFVVGITLFLSVALNNIISMSPLVSMSQEYQNASDAFYGSSFGLEILGSALITPFLEELLHRGVVYGRLRRMMGLLPSVLVSALIFAGLHFNIVQFIYAFLLGIVFALFMEKSGRLYPAVIAHVVANGLAVIRTETNFLVETVDGSVSAWFISVGCLLIGLGLLFFYDERKQES